MATDKNFIVKNGLEVGGQEVISSSGVVTSAALGGQTLSSTDSPTFNDLTLTGDLNLSGELNISGDINSLSVTDLDVADKTITLGAGQVESASGGSGIIVAGSNASILWDETNDDWDFNAPLHITHGTPSIKFTDSSSSANYSMTLDGVTVNNTNAGTNGSIAFHTHNGEKLRLGATDSYFSNTNVGIGTSSPASLLEVSAASNPEISITSTAGATDNKLSFRATSHTQPIQTQIKSDDNGNFTADLVYLFKATGTGGALSEKARLKSNGDFSANGLSIGNSTGNTRSVIDNQAIYTSYYGTETSPRIQLGRDIGINGGAGLALGGNSSYALIGTNDTSGTNLYFKAASAVSTVTTDPDMVILSSGRVGIGTINPTAKLHVVDNDSDDYIAIFKQTHTSNLGTVNIDTPTDNNSRPSRLDFSRGGTLRWKTGMVYGDTSNGWGLSDATGSGTAVQQTRFLVQPGGNVGINTHAPDALLHVSDTSPHIDIGPQGGNRGKIGYHSNDVIIGSTSSTGNIIFKNNISSTDSPQTSGDVKMTIADVGLTIHSDTYNILNLQTDSNNDQTSTDGIIKITNNDGSSDVTKAEFRWDESEDLVHVSYGDHGRHVSINSTGKVGIGTGSTSPTATLEVAGTALVENAKLKAIAESNTDTAVDVFVYDTRKDSDGGAWRKRTQHTSWYNETSGSNRSSRKEFPSVAVLAFNTSQELFIYDGDDPELSVWAKYTNFTQDAGGFASITAINGSIYCGQAATTYNYSGNGYFQLNFAADYFFSNIIGIFGTHRQGRADGLLTTYAYQPRGDRTTPLYSLAGYQLRDIAVTVLPNAPIDADTGLPVPTIAVATDVGMSVIKDDGNVYDSSDTSVYGSIEFIDGRIVSDRQTTATRYFISQKVSTIVTDSWNPYEYYAGDFSTGYPLLRSDTGSSIITKAKDHSVRGSNVGLSFWDWKESDNDSSQGDYFNRSLMAYVTSDHNTGWMHGDTKFATLSSTSTVDNTDYVGGAGTFANAGDWSTDSQWSVSGGTASYSGSGAAYISRTPTSNFVYGNWYYAELNVTSGNAGTLLLVNRHINGIVKPYTNGLTNVDVGFIQLSGTKYYAIWKQNSNNQNSISLYATSAVTVDNFKVYEMPAHDRSVNNNHFIKYGTINSSAVATGAELISYSTTGSIGNGNSDYLFQPYTADLDFGTGDFSTIIWYRQDSSLGDWVQMFQRGAEQYLTLRTHPSSNATYDGKILFKVGNASWAITNYNTIGKGWICIVLTRQNGITKMYVNGNLEYTTTSHNGTVNSGEGLSINPGGGKVALLRMSATVPSQEQIKKIYNDEKHLFQENAKAKIAGTSDAVTALAYDDDTELLHVGSSWGRSVFQGLNRVEYSTDVVTTAISASNGLVVEE